MANFQLSIKNSTQAKAWLDNVKEINQAYDEAMKDAGQTLKEMKSTAEGTVVDEFVNLGDGVLTAGQQVFNGIDSIADTVADVMQSVGDFVDDAKDTIKNVFSTLFG